MREYEFEKILVYDDSVKNEHPPLKQGDLFLSPSLASQKGTKKIGDTITMYLVVDVRPNGNILYKPVYDVLQQ